MSSFIDNLAINLIIFTYVSALKKRRAYIMRTISGTLLNSDLGQSMSERCLVPYTKH